MTGLSPGFAGNASQFGYDFDGNLTGITAAGNGFVSFVYDGLDRQLGWQTGAARLDYQLDGNAPLTETNQTTSRVNLYGNGLVSSGGETLLADGLGATRQTTNAAGNVQWSGVFTGYGLTSSASGGTGNPYGWGAKSGYRTDGFGPTGGAPLQKVGARYYDPEFGCFLTRDTELDQKPYAYCDSDPINLTDPSGHTAKKKTKKSGGQGGSKGGNSGGNSGGPISDTGKAIKEASEGVAKILEATHASASGELNVTVIHNGSYTKVVITLRIGVTK